MTWTEDAKMLEIGSIESAVAGQEAVGLDQGVGADQKVRPAEMAGVLG